MATIKHKKVDTLPDWTQANLDEEIGLGNYPPGTLLSDIVLPADWNDDHVITGTIPASNLGAAGTTGQLQYNNAGAFGGAAGLVYSTTGEQLMVNSLAAGNIPVAVMGFAGQTANLQEWQNSAGTALSLVKSTGAISVPDDAYSASWDGNTEVPTKNAIYDQLVGGSIGKLSTTTGINSKTVANTALYTVPTGKTAIITGYVVRCSAASAITTGATAGLGNAAGTNNISAPQAMNALLTTTDTFQWQVIGMSVSTAAAGVIYLNLGAAATGTSQTLVVDLMGYLI